MHGETANYKRFVASEINVSQTHDVSQFYRVPTLANYKIETGHFSNVNSFLEYQTMDKVQKICSFNYKRLG
jgi:hypothetical protein